MMVAHSAGIPYGDLLMSQLLHFGSNSLFMVWESNGSSPWGPGFT